MKIWSKHQEIIFDTYERTNKNIIIEATAGSGKTTTIVECCKRTAPHKKCFFSAFNKSIAKELRTRLPERIEVSTFHSKGLKVLFRNFNFHMKLNENKCFKMGRKILDLEDVPEKQRLRYLFELQDIWNLIRINLLTNYCNADINNICIGKDIEFRDRMVQDIKDIKQKWIKDAHKINGSRDFEMDFTDMLYLPYLFVDKDDFPKYDLVVADEVQDMNTLQRELLLRYIKPIGGRFIVVGDPRQNIYTFQGASVSNFRLLQNLDNTTTLPLDITYRCAKLIVNEAKTVFSDGIEAAEKAIEGCVRVGELKEANPGDFVLCRNNLPLVEAFINLLQNNKKATIKDKDFGNALCAVLDKITKFQDLELLKRQKIQDLMERGMSRTTAIQQPSYINLVEKCSIIERLSSLWNDPSVMEKNIERIYTENGEGVILSTIHKSKGLEAERVFFLNPDLIPSKYATTQEALYSEYCLKFVAITRAKKELIYCSI